MINNKQKIYWLHPHFNNFMGGHKYIVEVVTRLQKKYQVVLLVDAISPANIKRLKDKKIDYKVLSGLSTNSIIYWLLLPYFVRKTLTKVKNIISKDSLVIHSMFPMNLVANKLPNKTIQLCYEPFAFFHDPNFVSAFPFFTRLFIQMTSLLYKQSDIISTQKSTCILTLSKYNQKWIKQIYNANSIPVYEGVDTNFFKKTKKYDKQLVKYLNRPIIFHSTDFTKIKGTSYLIDALKLVLDEVPNAKLLITHTLNNLGEKKKIISQAQKLGVLKNIKFIGFVDYELLPQYLSLAKVVVQPSINQSMNLTVKEAMACQTPIITSPEGSEQTTNGAAGYLVKPTNPKQLAKNIIHILLNLKLQTKMGRKGLLIIKNKFTWDSVSQKFVDTINEITKN